MKKRNMAVLPSAKCMALGKRCTTQVTRFSIEWDHYV